MAFFIDPFSNANTEYQIPLNPPTFSKIPSEKAPWSGPTAATPSITDYGQSSAGFISTTQDIAADVTGPTAGKLAAEAGTKMFTEGKDFGNICSKLSVQEGTIVDATTGEALQSGFSAPSADQTNQRNNSPVPETITPTLKETRELKVILEYNAPARGDTNGNGPNAPDRVIFEAQPTLKEDRSASYDTQMTPVHHPGDIYKYKGTSARSWGLDAKLISRTTEEASKNVAYLNLIRSWVMPFHGEGTSKSYNAELGAPPPIITMSAYGPLIVGPVPCIVESYSINWPNNIDYVTDNKGNMIPVIIDVSMSLKESYSPAEYSGFDLKHYRRGELNQSFNRTIVAPKYSPDTDMSREDAKLRRQAGLGEGTPTPETGPIDSSTIKNITAVNGYETDNDGNKISEDPASRPNAIPTLDQAIAGQQAALTGVVADYKTTNNLVPDAKIPKDVMRTLEKKAIDIYLATPTGP